MNYCLHIEDFPSGSDSEESTCIARDLGSIPRSDSLSLLPLETIHSSILAWRIPWAKEPGELQSMGLQKSQT